MSRLIVFILLAGVLLAACSPLETVVPEKPLDTPAAPTGEWSLRMVHSGGIMGLHRWVEIDHEGSMTVSDERSGKIVALHLTEDELSQLLTLVAGVGSAAPVAPTFCADCFVYEVTLERGGGKPLTATVDDTSIAESGLSDLIQFVRALMEEALKN